MTRPQLVGAVVLAIGVTTTIGSMVLRLPREVHPPEALKWSKVAAERLEVGRRTYDARMLFSALGAADHALRIDSTFGDALIQRAVLLEELGLSYHAARAYAVYLKVDSSSLRSRQALRRMREQRSRSKSTSSNRGFNRQDLRSAALTADRAGVARIVRQFPEDSRRFAEENGFDEWSWGIAARRHRYADRELTITREIGQALRTTRGEDLVADAVAAIDVAVRAGDRHRIETLAHAHECLAVHKQNHWGDPVEGLLRLDTAISVFREAHSPMRWAAEYERASLQFWASSGTTACQATDRLVDETPNAYHALKARIYLQQARCFEHVGDYDLALQAYRRASNLFKAFKDSENDLYVQLERSYLLQSMGNRDAVWRQRRQTFASADTFFARYVIDRELIAVAREANSQGTWDVARSAAALVIDPPANGDVFLRVSARLLRAVAAWNQGDLKSARRDLRQARLATTTPGDHLRQFELQPIEATELALMRKSDPAHSKQLLAKSLANALASGRETEFSDRMLERSRAFRKINKHREAAATLSRTMKFLAQSPVAVAADVLSESYAGVSADIYTELVDLLEGRGDTADAFAVSERGRARQLLDRMGYEHENPLTVDVVRRTLPQHVLIVSFVSLGDRLVIFTIDNHTSHVTRVAIDGEDLGRRIEVLRTAIRQRGDWRAPAASMYDTLFGSLVPSIDHYETVVIVPDALLECIPFAMLINPTSGRFLVASSSLVIAPSASLYVKLASTGAVRRNAALVIGDPAFDMYAFPRLERLPAAAAEADEVARLYHSELLVGKAASAATFLNDMSQADVVHVGAHTLVNTSDAMLSGIVMASGMLQLRDIASRRVHPGCIAVLAGCRTATRTGTSDINSLALAFLAAGGRSSVGSLWDVEDVATRQFSVRLHRLLHAGKPAAEAVRTVQLEMMRSPNADLADVRSWAGFQVYGGG